ncbi:MAG: hypothetical protein NC247_09300 [Ruminococcus flavefaciens]|nr:hypothetical protein [Ruminococcus flavefaciens]MCM1361002.1 hypothetical protein [Clostridiales bacterium]MCM1435939.1 hypothetical protein [Ruminococcus flavefaciens]
MNILISLVIAIIIAAIVVGCLISQLKTVRHKAGASDYKKQDSFRLDERRDTFLYKRVTKTPINDNKK